MLPEQTPGAWQFGWDLKDAFFNTGRWAEHADYMGLQDTATGEFYRHRFAGFGGSDCPAHQQLFSNGADHGVGQGWREQGLGGFKEHGGVYG
jgi:hypothetical protein